MEKEVIDVIDTEVLAVAQKFVERRREVLKKRHINASGNLSGSIEIEILKQSVNDAASFLIRFAEAGRFTDMQRKSILYKGKTLGGEGLTNLMNWIEAKGADDFIGKWHEKHPNSKITDRNKILNAIAWGISLNRTKGKYKRKAWWNKSKTAMIADLYNQIASVLPPAISENIIKNLPKN